MAAEGLEAAKRNSCKQGRPEAGYPLDGMRWLHLFLSPWLWLGNKATAQAGVDPH